MYDIYALQSNLLEIALALRQGIRTNQIRLYPLTSRWLVYEGTVLGATASSLHHAARQVFSFIPQHVPDIRQLLHRVVHIDFEREARMMYIIRQNLSVHRMAVVRKALDIQDPLESKWVQFNAWEMKELGEFTAWELKLPVFRRYCETVPNSQAREDDMRRQLARFYEATSPFWKIFFDKTREAEKNLFLEYVPMDRNECLFSRNCYNALNREIARVTLEGRLGKSIPITPLAKLTAGLEIYSDERDALERWFKGLDEHARCFPLREFEWIIEDLAAILEMFNIADAYSKLLLILDHQCNLLKQADQFHLDWREALAPGNVIQCNGESFVLGPQLSPQKLLGDQYKIFAIQGDNDWVVRIANNRMRLKIDNAMFAYEHRGFPHCKIHPAAGVDATGSCMVVERLSCSMADYKWQSEGTRLLPDEEERAKVLANFIYCHVNWKVAPTPLILEHLMWDSQNRLKATRVLKPGKATYSDWEDFCAKASNGNFFVLSFLVEVSKLAEHPFAKVYRHVVEHQILNETVYTLRYDRPPGWRAVDDEKLESLCQEMKKEKEACVDETIAHLRKRGAYSSEEEAETRKSIIGRLHYVYMEMSTVNQLVEARKRTVAFFLGDYKKRDSKIATNYYKECFNFLIVQNQRIEESKHPQNSYFDRISGLF